MALLPKPKGHKGFIWQGQLCRITSTENNQGVPLIRGALIGQCMLLSSLCYNPTRSETMYYVVGYTHLSCDYGLAMSIVTQIY